MIQELNEHCTKPCEASRWKTYSACCIKQSITYMDSVQWFCRIFRSVFFFLLFFLTNHLLIDYFVFFFFLCSFLFFASHELRPIYMYAVIFHRQCLNASINRAGKQQQISLDKCMINAGARFCLWFTPYNKRRWHQRCTATAIIITIIISTTTTKI